MIRQLHKAIGLIEGLQVDIDHDLGIIRARLLHLIDQLTEETP